MYQEVKARTLKHLEWGLMICSMFLGMFLLAAQDLDYGSLDFFDIFPSHESTGLILIFAPLGYLFLKKFSYSLPGWLKKKNFDKIKAVFRLK